jgi:hypothetical protein
MMMTVIKIKHIVETFFAIIGFLCIITSGGCLGTGFFQTFNTFL